MGFGLLFIGFLLSINFVYAGFTDFLACFLMFSGMTKLSVYNPGFRRAKYALLPLMAMGLGSLTLEVSRFMGMAGTAWDMAGRLVAVFTYLFEAVFLWFLLSGIKAIALETRLPRLAGRVSRNVFLGAVYYLLSSLMLIDHPAVNEFSRYFGFPVWLFGLVWMALNALLIFSCYVWICLEGDEDMPLKESRFTFVNRLRAIEAAKEEEALDKGRKLAEKIKQNRKK